MNRADIARAIVACEQMVKELRSALTADAEAEHREQGTTPTWRVPGITVSASTSRPTAAIIDEAAFLAWVAERHPTEVEQITITRARPAWQADFLSRVAGRGAPACDDQGEEVPGLEWRPGGAFGGISIRPDSTLKAMFREHARQIATGARPLELPAPDSAA